jgi:putative transposase
MRFFAQKVLTTKHFVFFGLKHLDSVAACFIEHYRGERPHQGLENEMLPIPKKQRSHRADNAEADEPLISLRDVLCKQRLGGLLKHYSRKAA